MYTSIRNESHYSTSVIINDIILSKKQLNEFENTYGQAPLPGRYWYDSLSGLYGNVGEAATGFMYPDHDYGTLAENASDGTTRVFINGRELPQSEYMLLSQLLGNFVWPGYYWLDGQGNAGLRGTPFALVNLVNASQQFIDQRGRSSDDNFWSSRFASGNYSDDGQYGYVSVPGYGAVTYGI